MFEKESGSQKQENATVFRPVCTTISLVALPMCQIKSLETSENSKTNDARVVLQERMTFQNRHFDFNHYSRNM
jgi:hypothetical protein